MPSDHCFICHEGSSVDLGPVAVVCDCRWLRVHRECMSRWQLANAGSGQEKTCRFCSSPLPDWRLSHLGCPLATPVMSVVYNGIVHQIEVAQGESGRASFEADIRRIFSLEPDDQISLTFGCKVPGDETQELTLEGWGSFDAAVHCAALNAGAREKAQHVTPDRRSKRKALETPSRVFRRLFGGKQDEGWQTPTGQRENESTRGGEDAFVVSEE